MKKLLPLLSIPVLIAACTNDSGQIPPADAAELQMQAYKDSIKMAADTAGLAQFQQWKAQNELAQVQEPIEQETEYAATPAPRAKAPARKVSKAPVRRSSQTSSVASRPSTRSQSPAPSVGSGSDDGVGAGSGETAQVEKKQGMSKAAKGAIIGGAGGAITGAVVNKKNRAVGAVVGGILGAGGGYVIGRQMDKKDGRIEYTPQQ